MRRAALVLALALLAHAPAVADDRSAWGERPTPSAGAAEAIGGHALGCLAGARALPLEGTNYQVLRPQRNRNWGHPVLLRFVQTLAAQLRGKGVGPILVGDMAQPRGGPMAFGHGSHQTGLDVDILFRVPPRRLSAAELRTPPPVTMVTPEMRTTPDWGPAQAELLRSAAAATSVDRIFVNAAIKRALCRSEPPGRRAWLRKLRPWWGHDEHLHVRLLCPPGNADCSPQPPLPPGDGCGELDWWFGPEARAPRPKPAEPPPLPARCAAVLAE